MSCRRLSLCLLLLLNCVPACASDAEDLFYKDVSEVNDGELRFLVKAPDKPVHHHQNQIIIDDDSLKTGWIHLHQCHSHLDAVPRSQVVFREGFVRGLRILSADGIGHAWVEGPTVQLEGVESDAQLCLQADTRALSPLTDHAYFLRNGPYMRRFLDGYYPMQLSLSVHLDTSKLRFIGITPPPQPGFQVKATDGDVAVEGLFEGRLRTEMRFEAIPP